MANLLSRLLGGPLVTVLEQAETQPNSAPSLPLTLAIGDAAVTLRYLEPSDGPNVLRFARGLPAHDLLFLRRDITRADQVEEWLREVSVGETVTVLALANDEIVGYATVASDGLTWTRHVRELRVMVAESMRGKRLGRLLTAAAFGVAREQGAKKMVAQMTVDQRAAVAVFRSLGFQPEARLRHQVIDRENRLHDLQIMSLNVDEFAFRVESAIWASLVVEAGR